MCEPKSSLTNPAAKLVPDRSGCRRIHGALLAGGIYFTGRYGHFSRLVAADWIILFARMNRGYSTRENRSISAECSRGKARLNLRFGELFAGQAMAANSLRLSSTDDQGKFGRLRGFPVSPIFFPLQIPPGSPRNPPHPNIHNANR